MRHVHNFVRLLDYMICIVMHVLLVGVFSWPFLLSVEWTKEASSKLLKSVCLRLTSMSNRNVCVSE